MTPRPQLQIFRSIVVTYAILVMNRFVRFELSAKHLFHNRAMFWLLMTAVSLSTGQHYVAVFVDERPRAFANWRRWAAMPTHSREQFFSAYIWYGAQARAPAKATALRLALDFGAVALRSQRRGTGRVGFAS